MRWMRPAHEDPKGRYHLTAEEDTTSGHLDMARSNLIRKALAWSADWVGQCDADVWPEIDVFTCLRYLKEDFDHGAGIVFSPTTSVDWKPQFFPMEGGVTAEDPRSRTTPFACRAGAGGFLWMTREVASSLRVLAEQTYFYGTASGAPEKVPLYCMNDSKNDVNEDVSLMNNVRDSTGKLVVCDPRILTGTMKPEYRPSWRPVDKIPKDKMR